jgi:hypothetical protein
MIVFGLDRATRSEDSLLPNWALTASDHRYAAIYGAISMT